MQTTIVYRFEARQLAVTRTDAQVKRQAARADIAGNRGGWIDAHSLGRVQGWDALRRCAAKRVAIAERMRQLPPTLVEILEGRRIGTPTLSVMRPLELAVGLLAPGPVEWRDVPTRAPELRDDDDDLDGDVAPGVTGRDVLARLEGRAG